MKKLCLLITAICLLSFSTAQAQLGKGTIMTGVASTISLGGAWGSELMSLGFISSNDDYKETLLNILPRGGYFVMDNLVVGLDVILSLYTEKSSDADYKWTQSMLGVGPFTRYYYPLPTIYPFGEFSMIFGSELDKYKSGSYEDEDKWNVLMVELGGGVAKPIGDRATLDVMAGYSRVVRKYTDAVEDSKETCSGLIIKAGFTIYFGLL